MSAVNQWKFFRNFWQNFFRQKFFQDCQEFNVPLDERSRIKLNYFHRLRGAVTYFIDCKIYLSQHLLVFFAEQLIIKIWLLRYSSCRNSWNDYELVKVNTRVIRIFCGLKCKKHSTVIPNFKTKETLKFGSIIWRHIYIKRGGPYSNVLLCQDKLFWKWRRFQRIL